MIHNQKFIDAKYKLTQYFKIFLSLFYKGITKSLKAKIIVLVYFQRIKILWHNIKTNSGIFEFYIDILMIIIFSIIYNRKIEN